MFFFIEITSHSTRNGDNLNSDALDRFLGACVTKIVAPCSPGLVYKMSKSVQSDVFTLLLLSNHQYKAQRVFTANPDTEEEHL